jgi:hypothetical protein
VAASDGECRNTLQIGQYVGDMQLHKWDAELAKSDESHVVRIIRDAGHAVKQLEKSILLLDAYYLSVPALVALAEESAKAGSLLNIVVRAKKNVRIRTNYFGEYRFEPFS